MLGEAGPSRRPQDGPRQIQPTRASKGSNGLRSTGCFILVPMHHTRQPWHGTGATTGSPNGKASKDGGASARSRGIHSGRIHGEVTSGGGRADLHGFLVVTHMERDLGERRMRREEGDEHWAAGTGLGVVLLRRQRSPVRLSVVRRGGGTGQAPGRKQLPRS